MANEDKTLSPEGVQFIKNAEEEGGRPKLHAYNDGTGTWTIAWGCTKGVHQGMVITPEQADAMLATELSGHIANVHRLITRPISQGLFDALVSFFFNCGSGPALVAAVNKGGDDQIRAAFMLYTKAYDEKLGRKVTWPGLVKRRTAEIQHWAEMDHRDPAVRTPDPTPRLPVPVEPPKPSIAKEAKKSFSVKAMLTVVIGWLADTLGFFKAVLPEAKQEIDTVSDPLTALGSLLNLKVQGILICVTIVTLLVVSYRHPRDKAQLSAMQGDSDDQPQ